MGKGKPIDELDTACKAYKNCQRCVRMKHGENCIGEFTEYNYGEKNGDKICQDNAEDCARDLCECDLAFAKAHNSVKSVWKKNYHAFWSDNGWDHMDQDNCSSKSTFWLKSKKTGS